MLHTRTPEPVPQLLVVHECLIVLPRECANTPKLTAQNRHSNGSTTMMASADTWVQQTQIDVISTLMRVKAA